jgi:diguanylate cyclase (GGDEF)-like protein/PAS domain S-box-containing protein
LFSALLTTPRACANKSKTWFSPPTIAARPAVGVKGPQVAVASAPKKFPWQPLAVFTLLTLGLLALSFFYASQFRKFARTGRETELATIADLRAHQVSSWRQERLTVARNLFGSSFFPSRTESLLKNPGSTEVKREIMEALAHLHRNFPSEFLRTSILLRDGKVLFDDSENPSYRPTSESTRVCNEAWRTKDIVFGDLCRDPASGKITLSFAFPLLVPGKTGSEPIAVMVFDIDPQQSLYPLLQAWPAGSPTSETLLIQREGQDFLYLSEPRHQKNVALNLRLPITRFRRSGAETPIGEEGVIEGKDYRGHAILGFIRSVPDSSWLVEAKTDAAEVNAGWRRWFGLLSIIIIGSVLAAGISLSVFWRHQKSEIEADEREKWETALKNQKGFLSVMIDVMPNAAYLKDTEGRLTGCNAAFEKLLNLSKDKIVGKTFSDLTSKDLADKDQEIDRVLFEKPGVQVFEAPLQASDGAEHDIIFIKSTYARPDGAIGGLIGTMIDITQRKRAEDELQQIKKFSDGIVQTMAEGLVLTDSEGKFSFVNPAAAGMLGYTPGEMADREVASFVPKDQQSILRRADERRAKGIADRYELEFLHKDGSRKMLLVSGGPRFTGVQYGGTMAVLTDITERKRMEQEIRALSLTDPLTGLYNRRGFMHLGEQQLKVAARLNKRVFLLYSDVDDLKAINDTFGHKEGDRVLADLANVLKKSFRDSDIVARMGGDEFVVLAMEATKVNAEVFTRRLQEKLDHYNSRPDTQGRYTLTLSTGLSVYDPELPLSIDDLVHRADGLMYEQKRTKKK